MTRSDIAWPMYFATRDIIGLRVKILKGQPFPIQSKLTIRGYGPCLGVKDADTRNFADLGFVEVLDVGTMEMERHVLDRGLSLSQAKKLMAAQAEAA